MFREYKETCPKIFVDGTFEYCTKFFYQLFTIHGFKNGHYIPLLFCLLPNKSKEIHKHLFLYVKQLCLENGFNFELQYLVADFEEAIHAVGRDVWLDNAIKGCNFHLG